MATTSSLHWSDYLLFAFSLVGSLAVGLFFAFRRQNTTAEYLTGNRNLKFFPTSVSLVVSFFLAILFLGVPAEGYLYGGSFWLSALGWGFASTVSMIIFLPVFYPLKMTSVNKYLELRFNSQFVKILGTLAQVVNMYTYTATVFFAPATAINTFTGFSTDGSIIIGSLIAVIYTALGGIKAVIYVDVFQSVIMITGMLAVTFRSVTLVGGFDKMWTTLGDWNRLDVSFDPDPRVRLTFWSLIFGSMVHHLFKFGVHQAAVQRYCSMPTMNKARLVLLIVVPFTFIGSFLACLSGLAIFAFYTDIGCDPFAGKFIRNSNQLVPRFIGDALSFPGIQGILLASLAAGCLSTASSTLNAAAANIFHDFVSPFWPNMSEKKNLGITRGLVVLGGVICTALAYGVKALGGTIIQLTVQFSSATGGPSLSMFILGIFVPFANWIGVSVGGFGAFAFAMWITVGGWRHPVRQYLPSPTTNCSAYGLNYHGIQPHIMNMTTVSSLLENTTSAAMVEEELGGVYQLYRISYFFIAMFSMVFGLILGAIVSLLTGGMHQPRVPGNLLHPVIRKFYKGAPDVEAVGKDADNNGDVKINQSNGYLDEKKLDGHDNLAYVTRM